MDKWTRAINLYRIELIKEKEVQEKKMKKIQQRMHKVRISRTIVVQCLNAELSKLKSDLDECRERIDAHKTLILDTQNGSLDYPPGSDSE